MWVRTYVRMYLRTCVYACVCVPHCMCVFCICTCMWDACSLRTCIGYYHGPTYQIACSCNHIYVHDTHLHDYTFISRNVWKCHLRRQANMPTSLSPSGSFIKQMTAWTLTAWKKKSMVPFTHVVQSVMHSGEVAFSGSVCIIQ